MNDADENLNAWWDRVKGIRFINERQLFVTHDELTQMRRDFEVADEQLPPEVREARRQRALLNGQLDQFLGTPVVVDDEEAARQQARVVEAHGSSEGTPNKDAPENG